MNFLYLAEKKKAISAEKGFSCLRFSFVSREENEVSSEILIVSRWPKKVEQISQKTHMLEIVKVYPYSFRSKAWLTLASKEV